MSTFNNPGTGLQSTNLAAAWQEIVNKVAGQLTLLPGVTLTYNYNLAEGRITGNFSIPAESSQGVASSGTFSISPKLPAEAYEADGETLKPALVGSTVDATGDISGLSILEQFVELMEMVCRAEAQADPPVTGGVSFTYNADTELITGNYINPVSRSVMPDGSVKIAAIDYIA